MKNAKLNKWKETLSRDLGIKSSIIVTGNVQDICQDVEGYGSYNSVVDNIVHLVQASNFKNIYLWNGLEREKTIKGQNLQTVATPAASSTAATADSSTPPAMRTLRSMAGPATGVNPNADTTDEFFIRMHDILTNPGTESTAFILDYSDYLFGNANALSEKERHYLARISKALQAQEYDITTNNFFQKQGNVVIIVAKNLSTIPPIYYQNNPVVDIVNVPNPGRPERAAFVNEALPALKVNKALNASDSQIDKENFIDSLDGLKLKEIAQIFKLSQQNTELLSPEKLVNQFKYGEKVSPWEELDRNKLMTLSDTLKKRVKGQDEAVEKVRSVIVRAFSGVSGLSHSAKQSKPKGILFFVGPTGVGKTELAKAIAEFVFGDENACIRFDMSEYSQEQSDQKLIGAPPGYVGYEQGGELTNKVREKPFSVLLFDEVEKAHKRILDKFLQILEDGRLTDSKGQTVSFSETIIIFTSNIGAADMQIRPEDDKDDVRAMFIEAVRNHFVNELGRPEILNRIGDNVVAFNFINDPAVFSQIAKTKVAPLVNMMKEKYKATLKFQNEEEIFSIIAGKSDPRNGGRGVLNVIETAISNPLADFVFENMDDLKGRTVVVKIANPNLKLFAVEFE